MELTVDLIYNQLSNYFGVDYKVRNNSSTLVGRPVYYDKKNISGRNAYIITEDTIIRNALDKGVYIALANIPPQDFQNEVELLTVTDNVSERALFNLLQKIFDYYEEWEKKVAVIIEEDKGYQELISVTCKYYQCPISLIDEDMRYIGYSKEYIDEFQEIVQDNKVSPSAMIELVSNPLFEKVVGENDIFEYFLRDNLFLCYNFKSRGRYIGRVSLLCKDQKIKETYKFLLEVLVNRIEVLLKKYGSFLLEKNDYSALKELVRGLLNNKAVAKHNLESIISVYGWKSNDEYSIIRIQPEFRHEWQLHASYLIPQIEKQWEGTCAIEDSGYVMILLNNNVFNMKHGRNFKQELSYFLREGLMMAGVSRSFTNFEHIMQYYRQTGIAISMGRIKEPNRWCYYFDDYALYYWQKYGIDNFTPEQICSTVLLKLLYYDKKNNSQFYDTLITLCKHKYNYSQAANALFIHRTTFLYRLERITDITNLDINNGDERLYLELSYRYIEETKDNY